jgi:anti-sigma B factor antagonist
LDIYRVSPVAWPFKLHGEVAPLTFHTTLSSAGDALIALTGELDLSGATPLDEEIARLAGKEGVRRVVIDLRELEFMDSSGLRLVALAERKLSAAGRELVLVRGPDTVQRVFAITRMDEHLTFVDTPEAYEGDEAAA